MTLLQPHLLPSGTFHCTSGFSHNSSIKDIHVGLIIHTHPSLLALICSGGLTGELSELSGIFKETNSHLPLPKHKPASPRAPRHKSLRSWHMAAFFDRMCSDFSVSQSILPSQIVIVSYSHIPHPIHHRH